MTYVILHSKFLYFLTRQYGKARKKFEGKTTYDPKKTTKRYLDYIYKA